MNFPPRVCVTLSAMEQFRINLEEIKVAGRDLVEKVKALIHEGSIHRIIIKNEQGHTLIEVPIAIAAVGAIAAPVLAAVGAIAAMVTNCTIIVERREYSA
jgi:hypothetical protein